MIKKKQIEQSQVAFDRLNSAIQKVIVGHKQVIEATLIALLSSGNILLEGVPGLGKTLLVRTLASALGLDFSRIQFTPDLMPADIMGTNIITEDGSERNFTFSPGPVFANVVLADEINRATPKTQSALLEAMEEKTVTVGNETYLLEEPFIVLATQNPIEMEGTYPLPEAQVDRFLLKASVNYPHIDELVEIARRNTEGEGLKLPDPVASSEDILTARRVVGQIPVAQEVRRYVGRLVMSTHPHSSYAPSLVKDYVEYGASPRATLALIMGAKAHAFLSGEYHVRRKDIKEVFGPAVGHRVILNFKGEAEGVKVEDLLDEVWKSTEII